MEMLGLLLMVTLGLQLVYDFCGVVINAQRRDIAVNCCAKKCNSD
jgi:hypothetical protein